MGWTPWSPVSAMTIEPESRMAKSESRNHPIVSSARISFSCASRESGPYACPTASVLENDTASTSVCGPRPSSRARTPASAASAVMESIAGVPMTAANARVVSAGSWYGKTLRPPFSSGTVSGSAYTAGSRVSVHCAPM